MAVFLTLETDPFEENVARQRAQRRGGGSGTRDAGRITARRPLRGLEIKEDRPASIKVIQADGTELPMVDSGDASGQTQTYTNFILQSVTEARMEKHQIVETFGESYVYFFGEAPRFLDVQAVIINSNDFNWEAEWWENYETNLRGTKTVERGARLYMFYDDNIVEGYMLNCQAVKSSDQPHLIQMGFRLFVTSYRNITFVGDPAYPIRASVVLPDSLDLRDPDSRFQLFANSQGAARDAALAQNAADSAQLFSENDSGFGQNTSLTQLLRSAPRTVSFPPSVVASLEQTGGQDALRAALGNFPIRGLIADNTDEYIGTPEDATTNFEAGLPLAQASTVRSFQEVDDLWITAITALSCYGVDINNTKALQNMNLMPRFASGVNKNATFTPSSGVGFGTGLTDPRQLNAQRLSLPGNPANQASVTRDPLGVVFGSGTTQKINDRSTVQGGGDREYGYDSAYGRGPGYGKPGYGDFGGNGFGSGQGSVGDPGFKSPGAFSFAGVSEQPAAFNQFNAPTANNTVFGSGAGARVGLGASNGGLSGGAATRIGGRPSAFSVSSLPGTLEPTGIRALSLGPGSIIAGAVSGASLVNPCSAPFDEDTVSGPSVGF